MIYVIVGPTASGKSDAAIEIANYLSAPIISGDAFQIYQDMDIGTNKISKDDSNYKKHYMLDIITPDKSYSVKEYQEEARKILDSFLKENKDVVIVGGTGLYIKALLYDYHFENENVNYDEDLDELSNEELHKLLEELDFEESKKIHINNRKRLIRAISLIRHLDENKTEMLKKQSHKMIYKDVRILCINPSRDLLYENINKRVDRMIENGLVEEVKNLLEKYDLSLTAKAGIGYKEVISYLNKEVTLDECVELIKKRTRHYAKRQMTFFKHQFENISYFVNDKSLVKSIILDK